MVKNFLKKSVSFQLKVIFTVVLLLQAEIKNIMQTFASTGLLPSCRMHNYYILLTIRSFRGCENPVQWPFLVFLGVWLGAVAGIGIHPGV